MAEKFPSESKPWWREAVIYQIYPRSFADDNNDGMGDLAGVRSRLPYLADLGVDALWFSPFYPSPQADAGYDVSDYRDVDPLFGTLGDADALIREAHEQGLRVIVDIVPNHTSDQHQWFQDALAAGPGSPERERYHFADGKSPDGSEPPNDWGSVFGGNAWTRVPDGQWYLHLFASEQPDLNWRHQEVRDEFLSILRFWLDRGADGFRIDVAAGLFKAETMPDLNVPQQVLLGSMKFPNHPHWDRDEVHDVYRAWRAVADEYTSRSGDERIFVGEIWLDDAERFGRYLRPDELHTAFNFDFLKSPWGADKLGAAIDLALSANGAVGAPATWVLNNHDVTRNVTRYGDGDRVRGVARARAAALLMLALPGAAYIYQGEELGLPEVENLPEELLQDPTWERSGHTVRGRDGCRVPLPWKREGSSYGFGSNGSWLPQPSYWGDYSVEAQDGDKASMLELYREALRLRRSDPSLGEGPFAWVDKNSDVLSFTRGEAGQFTCVINLGTKPTGLPAYDSMLLASAPLADGQLPADAAVWLRTG